MADPSIITSADGLDLKAEFKPNGLMSVVFGKKPPSNAFYSVKILYLLYARYKKNLLWIPVPFCQNLGAIIPQSTCCARVQYNSYLNDLISVCLI
jgi:hypothetical protein